jgi:hypothetical protein
MCFEYRYEREKEYSVHVASLSTLTSYMVYPSVTIEMFACKLTTSTKEALVTLFGKPSPPKTMTSPVSIPLEPIARALNVAPGKAAYGTPLPYWPYILSLLVSKGPEFMVYAPPHEVHPNWGSALSNLTP